MGSWVIQWPAVKLPVANALLSQENSLNSATGKLSAPKLKKRDPRTEVFDRLKVFNGVQVGKLN